MFKCRIKYDDVECTGGFTLFDDKKFEFKAHCSKCKPKLPIECEIMKARHEIINEMDRCPSISVQQLWENKEIELTVKYGAKQVAIFWPDFNSVESALFVKKNKFVPKLPTGLLDLKEIKEPYNQTKSKLQFLITPIVLISQFITFASVIGLSILALSEK